MKRRVLLLTRLAALAFAATAVAGEKAPDLDDRATIKKLSDGALNSYPLAPTSDALYTGWVKWSHESGKIWMLVYLKEGKNEGPSAWWYENGQKWREYYYEEGKREGLFVKWHRNGTKAEEVHFTNGKLDGLSTYWDRNGKKKHETRWRDDKKVA